MKEVILCKLENFEIRLVERRGKDTANQNMDNRIEGL